MIEAFYISRIELKANSALAQSFYLNYEQCIFEFHLLHYP